MRYPAYLVMALWGLFNGLLAGILGVYGEMALALWLFGSVAVFLELCALVVLVSSRTEPEEHRFYRVPVGGGAAALPAAVGAGLVGLAFVYGWWLISLAVPMFAVALVLLVRRGSTKGRPT